MVWLKAAVLGSLWASVEILLGSFLHNLRVPFSGSTLAFIAVWLVVAFSRNWKEKGLIWRAGLIAALMKSISPSAVIMGPMIGIFTEALLLELAIRLLGRNMFGFIVGGSLAVLSALMHKAINLLVLYGFDLVMVLQALFRFSAEVLNMEGIGLRQAFYLLASIYGVAGILAAIAGYLSGAQPRKRGTQVHRFLNTAKNSNPDKNASQLFTHTTAEKYATPFLFLNLAAVLVALFLIGSQHMIASAFFAAAYLGFCFYRYRRAFNRIRRFSFWIPFMIITLVAATLIGGMENDTFFSLDGLMIGIRMNVRAFVLITGFAAISTEMKNPAIKMILYNRGFANLYQALNLAFSALPAVIEYMSAKMNKGGLKRFSFTHMFSAAESLLKELEQENELKSLVIIITGAIGEGKTSFAASVVGLLKEKRIPVSGFLSIGVQSDGERTGFELTSLSDNDSILLCSTNKTQDWQSFGRYSFNPEALQKGREIIVSASSREKRSVLMIDEIGPLEMNDTGWAEGIKQSLNNKNILHCWVVRRSLAQQIARKWNVGDVYIADIGSETPENVCSLIVRLYDRKKES